MAFWLGICPSTFLSDIDPAVARTIASFKEKWAAGAAVEAPKMLSADSKKDGDGQKGGDAPPADPAP
jgi:hypothetical protein